MEVLAHCKRCAQPHMNLYICKFDFVHMVIMCKCLKSDNRRFFLI